MIRARLCVLLGLCVSVLWSCVASAQPVRQRSPRSARANSPDPSLESPRSAAAPGGSPLLDPISGGEAAGEESEAEEAPAIEADPLVGNGLGSPSCRPGLGSELSASERRNCETSGFIAAPSPTSGYGIDIHIDTGLIPLNGSGLLSTVQNLFVTPIWMALLWLVHALVVMLEWGFSIDLLEGAPASSLQRGLARAQATITTPLLAVALSVAAVALAYDGLIRRRVADTLGEALLAAGMFACGFWLMLDPSGTVGTLSRLSNQVGLGTLAVVVGGTPTAPARSLGASMAGVYATSIESPWCYLEFGDVGWCRDGDRLEPGLKAAGQRIAARRMAEANCSGKACEDGPETVAGALRASARLLREARTNGALFTALPANGPDRNSINDRGSLLRTLCRSAEATDCRGPGAAEAEFRTDGGTWPRVGGLLLIAIGLLGMMLLFGYIGAKLLLAAALSLLYLLLVPAVILSPAFGDAGRALFRSWAMRLFGAVFSKLIFAFLLGTVIAVTTTLEELTGLGWWAQWLLLAAFWWGAFLKRNDVLGFEGGSGRRVQASRILREALTVRNRFAEETGAGRNRGLGWKDPAVPSAAGAASGQAPAGLPPKQVSEPSGSSRDAQVARVLQAEFKDRPAETERAARASEVTRRLARIALARTRAELGGDPRRARQLEVRATRIRQELAEDPWQNGQRVESAAVTARTLDEQARLPRAGERAVEGQRRDYPKLAALAGYTRSEYERLDRAPQRAARLQIDRELAARRGTTTPGSSAGADAGTPILADAQDRPPVPRRRDPRPAPRARAEEEDPVMRDVCAVAEGRKRQLGFDNP